MKGFPRRFEESSNQHSAKGLCHGLGIGKDGRPYALLEYDTGWVKVRHLDGHYLLKFEGDSQ